MITLRTNTVALSRVVNAARIWSLFVTILSVAPMIPADADGGVVQFEKSQGGYTITIFTTPSPLRAGPVDISVMIRTNENQPVLDCGVVVQLQKESAMSVRSEATHEAAQNKLLYAAQVKLPQSGVWDLEVTIKHLDESITVDGAVNVAPANTVVLAYWRSLGLPPLFISLFALNQWLKRRRVKRESSSLAWVVVSNEEFVVRPLVTQKVVIRPKETHKLPPN